MQARLRYSRRWQREVAGIEFWGTMKKIVLATVLAALGSASALAADLGPRAYTKAPMMAAPVSSWQGFYIGGNVGYGWGGDGRTDFSFLPDPVTFDTLNATLDTKPKGVLGGAQIGYNWQMGSLVTGFEADIQGSGIKGSAQPIPAVSPVTGPQGFVVLRANHELSWFGTVRGRLGATITPDLLLYGTGGLAYGGIKAGADLDATAEIGRDPFASTVNKTKAGWTAGAGAEWMFARNWSAKAEYLFVDLGKVSDTKFDGPLFGVNYTWHTRENIVRAGVNYHF